MPSHPARSTTGPRSFLLFPSTNARTRPLDKQSSPCRTPFHLGQGKPSDSACLCHLFPWHPAPPQATTKPLSAPLPTTLILWLIQPPAQPSTTDGKAISLSQLS